MAQQYEDLIAVLKHLLFERFAPIPKYTGGLLGDGLGNVTVPDRPDKCFARFNRNSTNYFEIFNVTVPHVNDWPVKIGEFPWQPGLTQVVGTDWSVYEQSGWGDSLGTTSPHAPTHEWPDGSPGSDPVDVHLRAIVPLRAYLAGTGTTTVYVNSLEYEYQGSGHVWGGLPGVDLAPAIGATVTGTMRYMGIYLDPVANILAVVTGATTVYSDAITPPLVSFPAGVVPAARVRIYGNQGALAEADFRDGRRLFNPVNTASGGSGAWASPGKVNLWDVTGDTVTEYANIQLAIDDAGAGDTVVIGAGEWDVTGDLVTVNKAIYVTAAGRPTVTSSGADEIAVTISNASAIWDGIDIETTSTSGDPRALKLTAGTTVRNCRVDSSTGGDTTGYAIEIDNCAPTLENVVSLGYDYSLYSHNGSTTRNVIMAGGSYSGGIGTNVEIGNNFVINAIRDPVVQGNISTSGNGRLDGVIKSSPGYGPQILGNSTFYFGGVAFDGVVTGAGGGASFPGSDTKFLTEASLDDLAKIQHIIDGGHPANPYTATPNADDAEFNNSTQAENNTIGTHAGGDFWEWKSGGSYGTPSSVSINSPYPSHLYVYKNAGNNGVLAVLIGNIGAMGNTEDYLAEIVISALTYYNKRTTPGIALRFFDSSNNKFLRIRLDDTAANGVTVIGSYDTGGGETVMFSVILGHMTASIALGLRRYESGGSAFGRPFFAVEGPPNPAKFSTITNIAVQNMGANNTFNPDEVWLEFYNTGTGATEWIVDSYRRTV